MHGVGRGALGSKRSRRGASGRRILLALLCGLAASLLGPFTSVLRPLRVRADELEDVVRDELNARRRYRGVQPRVFQKALRHELSVLGGGYAADLTSSSYLVSGAYTFHVSEDLGLEASFGYTRAKSELIDLVEERLAIDLVRDDPHVFLYAGHVLWTLAYGKMRWFHSALSHFDLYLALGGGITDNRSTLGLTFSGGLGLKLYPTRWLALRFDLRDQLLNQELLGESRIVNNLVATFGLSTFIPF